MDASECRLRLALLSSIDRWSVLQVRLLCRRRLTIHHHNFGGTVIRSRTDPSPAARCEGKCMGVGTGGRVHLYPLLGLTQDEHASRIKPFTFGNIIAAEGGCSCHAWYFPLTTVSLRMMEGLAIVKRAGVGGLRGPEKSTEASAAQAAHQCLIREPCREGLWRLGRQVSVCVREFPGKGF